MSWLTLKHGTLAMLVFIFRNEQLPSCFLCVTKTVSATTEHNLCVKLFRPFTRVHACKK